MNIEINHKENDLYSGVYPATAASLISYTNSSLSGVTNVAEALLALNTYFSTNDKPTTSYSKISTTEQKTQLNKLVSGTYYAVRLRTTAAQVSCYNPATGELSNLKDVLDYIVENYIN